MNITRKSLRACYRDLAERASIDLDFLLLTVVAAVICTFGFRMNSASVIIGAMVISPLLYPVICVGAATFHRERGPFLRAAATLAAGLLSAIVAAAIVSLFATTRMRSEIVDRVSMQAVDYLFVALFSGVAGTYAFFSPKVHEAIAGIAISVALVPPVAMLGIGIANRDAGLVYASVTIVLCNVCGIYIGSIAMVAGLHWITRDRDAI
ncbi:MAG: DUF389 domain-containing protein [Rhizomicrobium sp.]